MYAHKFSIIPFAFSSFPILLHLSSLFRSVTVHAAFSYVIYTTYRFNEIQGTCYYTECCVLLIAVIFKALCKHRFTLVWCKTNDLHRPPEFIDRILPLSWSSVRWARLLDLKSFIIHRTTGVQLLFPFHIWKFTIRFDLEPPRPFQLCIQRAFVLLLELF